MDDLDTLKEAAMRLEADMRAYIFDRTPDRRRSCLDRYRERLGLKPWAVEQEEQFEAARALHAAKQANE